MIESTTLITLPMMDSIGDRIRYVRKSAGLTQEKFAGELKGVSRGAVGNWELGEPISRENLQAIAKRWRVSLDWLAEGKGPTPDKDDILAAEAFRDVPERPPVPFTTFDPDEWSLSDDFDGEAFSRENYTPETPGALPELDLKAGAGEGVVGELVVLSIGGHAFSGHRVIDEWPFPQTFLHNSGTSPDQSIVVEVIGESMLPTYLPGDRVVVDLSQNRMMADGIYMWSDGHSPPQVKRLQRVPFTNPPRVSIVSDNKAYEPYEANIDDVKIFGRITWHLGRR